LLHNVLNLIEAGHKVADVARDAPSVTFLELERAYRFFSVF